MSAQFIPTPPTLTSRLQSAFSRALIVSSICVVAAPSATSAEPQKQRVLPEIRWDTTLRSFQFDDDKFIGQRLTVRCPRVPVNGDLEPVFGTDVYPSESAIGVAALHAGVIGKEGGTVTIQLNPGEPEYKGSTRHGVTSADLPATRRSIVFVKPASSAKKSTTTAKTHLEHLPTIAWDTKFTATGYAYRHLVGQQISFRLPPVSGTLRPRLVYGTDHYDFASRIGFAALHAGVVTEAGGIVTVQIDEGVSRLNGSLRHGIETKSKGSGDRTISFVANPVKE